MPFSFLTAVAIVAAVATGCSYSKEPVSDPPADTAVAPTDTLDPTEDWETFTDPRFDLTFEYPEVTPNGTSVQMQELDPDPEFNAVRILFFSEGSTDLFFMVAKIPETSTGELYQVLREASQRREDSSVSELRETVVDQYPAVKFDRHSQGDGWKVIFIQKGEDVYEISYLTTSLELSLQILATLRFL